MGKLSRSEMKAQTRACLLESAARVFSRRGMHQTSIDEVAADAGYTKGAFYASFKSKEDLFLAMLDEHFAEQLDRMDRVIGTDSELEDQAREGGAEFIRHISADPEWERLFFEFAAHAARNDEFRGELVTRYRALRERIADLYRRRAAAMDVEPPVTVEELSTMTFAMANGIAMQRLLEPESVPDDLYPTMLALLFGGVRAMHDQAAVT